MTRHIDLSGVMVSLMLGGCVVAQVGLLVGASGVVFDVAPYVSRIILTSSLALLAVNGAALFVSMMVDVFRNRN